MDRTKNIMTAGLDVLVELENALRRLGDDPRYYECDSEMCGELAKLNPELVNVINAFTQTLSQYNED